MTEVFHAGERAVQTRIGVRDKLASFGARVIREAMPDQHREFFEQLPFVLVGGLDDRARVWASIAFGAPGFIRSPDDTTLSLAPSFADGDPLVPHLRVGAPVGLLGIELHTRRRNRANGRVQSITADGMTLHVTQSFGNCPKYIRLREPRFVREPRALVNVAIVREGSVLSRESVALIENADTFFIATASAEPGAHARDQGVDISHRGGEAGFVQVIPDEKGTTLLVPDYVGNYFFNTLGNIEVNPRAGLLFIDFASGTLLSLTVDAHVLWEGELVDGEPRGERLIAMRVVEGVRLPDAIPLRFSARRP